MLYTRFKTILSLLYRLIAQNKEQVDEQSHPKDGLLLPSYVSSTCVIMVSLRDHVSVLAW